MTKSELMEKLSAKQPTLSAKEIENMVKDILEFISQSLEMVIVLKFEVLVAFLYIIGNHVWEEIRKQAIQ